MYIYIYIYIAMVHFTVCATTSHRGRTELGVVEMDWVEKSEAFKVGYLKGTLWYPELFTTTRQTLRGSCSRKESSCGIIRNP
jgi:hypothetical protein